MPRMPILFRRAPRSQDVPLTNHPHRAVDCCSAVRFQRIGTTFGMSGQEDQRSGVFAALAKPSPCGTKCVQESKAYVNSKPAAWLFVT